ncbi:chaplin family protein [Nonomuraea sp. NPDC049480]|uniref:chaplin family protein n=1 Tax=Nonomuraea sp. NPDC049480 TaxID=3364353 RepID=UPI0037BCF80C
MLKKTLAVAGVAAMLPLAAPAAHAVVAGGDGSVLSGNQVHPPVGTPIDVCGNAVAVIGHSIAGCKGGAGVGHH